MPVPGNNRRPVAAMTGGPPRGARPPRPVSARSLENAALRYLERFASSADSLRRVLMRRVERSVAEHGTDRDEAAGWVEALIARYRTSGLLDDGVYARHRAESLHRRGASVRAIRERLASRGVEREIADSALDALAEDAAGDPDRAAAIAFARRRRLGPFRRGGDRAAGRDRDLAALGRAGFGYDLARRVIDAATPDDLEDDAPAVRSG